MMCDMRCVIFFSYKAYKILGIDKTYVYIQEYIYIYIYICKNMYIEIKFHYV